MNKRFMWLAINEARKCEKDVPVAALIVKENKIIAKAHNLRECDKNPVGHAEIIAIQKAAKMLKDRRLSGCTIYVTLEPCPMCAGAIILSGIEKIVFGAYDEKYGCVASKYALTMDNIFNSNIPFVGGVLENECKKQLNDFFQGIR